VWPGPGRLGECGPALFLLFPVAVVGTGEHEVFAACAVPVERAIEAADDGFERAQPVLGRDGGQVHQSLRGAVLLGVGGVSTSWPGEDRVEPSWPWARAQPACGALEQHASGRDDDRAAPGTTPVLVACPSSSSIAGTLISPSSPSCVVLELVRSRKAGQPPRRPWYSRCDVEIYQQISSGAATAGERRAPREPPPLPH
jgi:hypothetical protein